MKLRMHDADMGQIKHYIWSGDEVLNYTKFDKTTYSTMKALNNTDEMRKNNSFLYIYYLIQKYAKKLLA